MLSVRGRRPAAVVVVPIAKKLLRLGVTPNQVTIISAALSCAAIVTLIPSGHLLAAALTIAAFTAFDLVDGTMARLSRGGTRFGATLDATCDRITDGALFSAIIYYLVYTDGAPQHVVIAAFVVLVASQVISYVKARAEASGIPVNGGLVERAERLIVALLGLGFAGLGVPLALPVALWLLCIGSAFTVAQRLLMVRANPESQQFIKPPAGA